MNQTFTSFQEFKRRYPISPNDTGALLGSGSYGRVIKVEDQLETEWVAIKISEFKGSDTKSLKAEVDLARRVPRQANIARYEACYRLETDTSISDFAIMKYYPDGNLADLLRRETLTEAQRYEITRGILLGLQHLHHHRIVHRDFKPANILISRDHTGRFIPKIADFGLSKLVSDDELDSSDFDLSDGRGTPSYKAPEQIEGSKVSFNLDLWAFGIILYEMLTGEKPFRADARNVSEQSIRRAVEMKIITVELPDRLAEISEPYQTMIRRCLIRDIHQRVRKEDELLDLLDRIPQLLKEARTLIDLQEYEQAILRYEQVLARRENQAEAKKGITQCKVAIGEKYIHRLLHEADGFIAYQQFEGAKNCYEQVLQLVPDQEKAIQGLAFCIEQLRPKVVVTETESTDIYQPDTTDVYVAPSVVAKPVAQPAVPVAPAPIPAQRVIKNESRSAVLPPVAQPSGRKFPWRIVVPAALLVGGLMGYSNWKTGESGSSSGMDGLKIPAGETADNKSTRTGATVSLPEETKTGLVVSEKEVIKKRVDVALEKARLAFGQNDYATALMLTNSALQLDPGRRDVMALRDAAAKESGVKEEPQLVVPAPETTEKPPLTAASVVPETTDEENRVKAKKEVQERYEQLIEEGSKAILKNNKSKAIGLFSQAQSLAKEHDLNTSKVNGNYSYSMGKGNSYLEREEYEGAKGWFLVAQSLKDTEEVRRKIKQCTH